jgi:hypothetical protein
METLPQLGDTTEKQITKMKAKFDELKADAFTFISPTVQFGVDTASKIAEGLKTAIGKGLDAYVGMRGLDPNFIKKAGEVMVESAQKKADASNKEKRALEELNEEQRRGAEAMEQSAKNAQVLSSVIQKFQSIIDKTREAILEFRAALMFEDNMRAFLDADAAQAWEDAISQTRNQNAKQLQEIRDRKKQDFDNAMAQQMQGRADAEDILKERQGELWRDKIAKEGMTRGERKAARQEERDFERNQRRAEAREARDRLREEKREARKAGFDELKRNGFFDEEAAKKRIKDQVRKEADDAVKKSALTLTEILTVLKQLATA